MNKNKKEYIAPKIIETFQEEKLLENIGGAAYRWMVISDWINTLPTE